jgi:hypothetical protein
VDDGTTYWMDRNHPDPLSGRISDRSGRLKALGNSVNPYCAAIAFERIMEIEKANV